MEEDWGERHLLFFPFVLFSAPPPLSLSFLRLPDTQAILSTQMYLGLLYPVGIVTKSLERLRAWLITPVSMVELPTYPSPKPTFCPK